MAETFAPLPHQVECLRCIAEARRAKRTRALIVMASRLGKTVTAAHFAKRLVGSSGKKVLFLVHQNDILAQARVTFEIVLGGPGSRFGFFHGREKNRHQVQFLFASFQTMRDRRTEFAKDEFALVIVDESHHGPAATYRPTIEYFEPEFLLGMTATPNRTDLQNIREIYGPEVFDLPLEKAFARGLLTETEYVLLTDDLVRRRLDGETLVETAERKLRLKDLNRLFAIPRRDDKVVALIEEKIAEKGVANPRLIVFCPSIRYAEWLHTKMPGSIPIHSRLPDRERDLRMAMYRAGDVRAALVVDQFNEGIDIPEANVAVFLRSTASAVVFFQQLARVLTKVPGKDKALVLDLVGNCERLEMVRSLREAVDANRGPRPDLEHVEVHFKLEFTETAQRVLDLVRDIRNRFDRAQMIADLQELGRVLGRTPTGNDVIAASKAGKCAALTTYFRAFGSFNAALRAAGFATNAEPTRPRAREQMIAELQDLAKTLARTPNKDDVTAAAKDGKCAGPWVLRKHFGSFNAALREAGLTPNHEPSSRTRARMIADLQELGRVLGRTPHQRDVEKACKDGRCVSVGAYQHEFGAFNPALLEAGFTPTRRPNRRSRAQMITELQELGRVLSRTPTTSDINCASKEGRIAAYATFKKAFGSLSAALIEAGLASRRTRRRSRDELLADLQELGRELGRTPTTRDVNRAAKEGRCASSAAYQQRFRGFNRALREAGFTPPRDAAVVKPRRNESTGARRRPRSRDEMIAELQELARVLGRTPTAEDISRASKEGRGASLSHHCRVFGTYNAALEAAGLAPNRMRRTRQQMIDDYVKLSEELGRSPTQDDMNEASKAGKCGSANSYLREFGSTTPTFLLRLPGEQEPQG